jgi:Cys-rich repeat protein
MKPASRITTLGALVLALAHCSSSATGNAGAGNPYLADAGQCEGTATHGETADPPLEHRATRAVCGRTPEGSGADGSLLSCSSSTDCQVPGGGTQYCAQQQCGPDQCLVDADCDPGRVCVCASEVGGGIGPRLNLCVPSNCTVDSDCGAGGYCSPSRSYCGGVTGYYCHSNRDTCVDSTTDCSSCGGNSCVYAPTVGHFVCGTSTCDG